MSETEYDDLRENVAHKLRQAIFYTESGHYAAAARYLNQARGVGSAVYYLTDMYPHAYSVSRVARLLNRRRYECE